MTAKEQRKIIAQLLEDQPVMRGYIISLADDFSESEHGAIGRFGCDFDQ